MKKIIFFTLLILAIPLSSYCKDKIPITFFHSAHCKVCLKVKKEILPAIQEKYKDRLEWRKIDTAEKEGLEELIALTSKFQMEKALVPAVLIGDALLVGRNPIETRLEIEIQRALRKEILPLDFLRVDLVDIFKKFSVFAVMASGVIDGINPCAFAVIVFFISFLSVYGYRKKEVICVGTAYIAAVFVTYLLMGMGAFGFLQYFEHTYLFIKLFYYFVGAFCFLMGTLALYDYFKFKVTNDAGGSILQLPKFLKKKINIVIGSGLRSKGSSQRSLLSLVLASLLVGFLVSILEAACTGQMYLPTIVFILKNTDLKLKAFFYLILYNVMFILPLIIIFLMSIAGISSQWFNNFLKKNSGRIKIMMAFIFFLLGALILYIS